MNKVYLIICFWAMAACGKAQNNCGCTTANGVNSITTEGKVAFKGKNKDGNFVYDLSLVFINQTVCKVFIPDLQFNDNEKILQPKLNLPANSRNKKIKYHVLFTTSKELVTQPGLDDELFAEIIVGYFLGSKACDYNASILYTNKVKLQ